MMHIIEVKAEFLAGDVINVALEEAFMFAKKYNCCVKFSFNGVRFNVKESSDVKEMCDLYYKALDYVVS